MADDQPTMEVLTREECLAHLARHRYGRLARIVDGRPDMLPVNYVLDDGDVAVRTDAGTGLDSSAMTWVAFEIDHVDPESQEGWSVVVRGFAHDITDALDAPSARTRGLVLTPWAPGEHGRWIKITQARVTGRRLSRPVGSPPPPGS